MGMVYFVLGMTLNCIHLPPQGTNNIPVPVLSPDSATGNQQHPCAGPKPGQRRKVCQIGGDTLAVKDQDD